MLEKLKNWKKHRLRPNANFGIKQNFNQMTLLAKQNFLHNSFFYKIQMSQKANDPKRISHQNTNVPKNAMSQNANVAKT